MCRDDAPLTNGFVADMVLFITGEADPVSQVGRLCARWMLATLRTACRT
jgi:hypothetical protein